MKKLLLITGLILASQIWSNEISTTTINLVCDPVSNKLCNREECKTFPAWIFEEDPDVDAMSPASLSFVKTTIKDLGNYYSATWGVTSTDDVQEIGNVLTSVVDVSDLADEWSGKELVYNLDMLQMKYWRIVRDKASKRTDVESTYQCKEAKKNPFTN